MEEVATEAAQIFLKAATYIRQYGWQKSGMSTHGKPRCSMGALASAHSIQIWNKNLSALMYRALYDELNGMTLTQFNEKVKSGLEAAILFENVATKLNQLHINEARN